MFWLDWDYSALCICSLFSFSCKTFPGICFTFLYFGEQRLWGRVSWQIHDDQRPCQGLFLLPPCGFQKWPHLWGLRASASPPSILPAQEAISLGSHVPSFCRYVMALMFCSPFSYMRPFLVSFCGAHRFSDTSMCLTWQDCSCFTFEAVSLSSPGWPRTDYVVCSGPRYAAILSLCLPGTEITGVFFCMFRHSLPDPRFHE